MKHGATWYRRFGAEFIAGCVGLTARQIAVYALITDLLYVHGGEILNDPKWIGAPIKGMSIHKVAKVIDELVALGKIEITGKGNITNHRVSIEAKTREEISKANAEAGKKGGQVKPTKPMLAIVDGEPVAPNERAKAEDDLTTPAPTDVLRERFLLAMGYDKTGLTASGKMLGSSHDMQRVERWKEQFNLSDDEVIGVVEAATANASGTIMSFRYFEGPITTYAQDREGAPRQRTMQRKKADDGWTE